MKSKDIFSITIVISGLFLIVFFDTLNEPSCLDANQNDFTATVQSVKQTNYGIQAVILYQNEKILLHSKKPHSLKSGMTIQVSGVLEKPSPSYIPNAFNYKEYLRYQKIHYVLSAENIIILNEQFHMNQINETIQDYFDQYPMIVKTYLNAFILGNDDYFSASNKLNITRLGISHLFAISGLHISILIGLLQKGFNSLKITKQVSNKLILVFLSVYAIASSFMISIVRAVSMEAMKSMNQSFKLGLTSLDMLSIIFLAMIMINPFYLMHLGFQLSFVVTYGLIISGKLTSCYTSYWLQSFVICTIAMIFSFVFIVNINYEINLWTLIVNVGFVYVVSSFILPFTFIVAMIPPMTYFYETTIYYYDYITNLVSQLLYIPLLFSKQTFFETTLFIIITYVLFVRIETKKAKIIHVIAYLLVIVLWSLTAHISLSDQIYFLAVSNGDATVIIERFGRCTMVIDTGEGRRSEVTSFLKSNGIRSIDYLVITHGDLDHMGEALEIINQFQVNKIVTNEYDYSSGMSNIIQNSHNHQFTRAKQNEVFSCGTSFFQVLSPSKDWNNTNNNSLVLLASVFGTSILFTGDIGVEVELDLIYNYPNLEFDILKVAHHGSITSTSFDLVNNSSFTQAVIMTGMNNRFGFPNSIVIDRLKGKSVYRTDLDYTIVFKREWFQTRLTYVTST